MQRYKTSSAYIDSYTAVIYVAVAAALAGWIAFETRDVINPWWLGVSIVTLFVYFGIISWLLNQFHDVNRIFTIYGVGILCLGLIVSLVAYVTGIRLPTDLPILSYFASGLESYDPGSVAISYAIIVMLAVFVLSLPLLLLDDTRFMRRLVMVLHLHKLDYIVDRTLDWLGYKLDLGTHSWLVVLFTLLVIVNVIVVGGAALI